MTVPKRVRRLVSLSVSTAQIRTAMYGSEERMIVPVIIMKGNAVVRPLYSEGPEFVPTEELSKSYITMNGRPVVPDHPLQGLSSANDPAIKAAESFGEVFNCKMVNGDMHGEMWLSKSLAKNVGSGAEFAIDTLEAGEMIEISCGAYVALKKEKGTSPNGMDYEYRWSDLSFDHLAAGLNGSEGACSIETGCGAPRTSKGHNNNKSATRQLRSTATKDDNNDSNSNSKDGASMKGLARKFKSLLSTVIGDSEDEQLAVRRLFVPAAEGMGSKELNSHLSSALFAAVPAYGWLWDSYPDDSTVIYTTQGEDWSYRYWMRSYTVDDDNTVTLGDDEQEMIFDEAAAFVPKNAKDNDNGNSNVNNRQQKAASCECHRNNDSSSNSDSQQSKGAVMLDAAKKKELIARLLKSARVQALKYDETKLAALSDDVLIELDAIEAVKVDEPPAPVVETPKVETKSDSAPVELTEEQWLAQAPKEVRETYQASKAIVAEQEAKRAARKAELVASLKDRVKDVHTEDQLKAMSVEQLESTEKLLKLNRPSADYSGRGFPITSAVGTKDDLADFMPPDSYGLVAARNKKTETATDNGTGTVKEN